MTAACLGVTDPPAELAELVRANVDGLPFFVEELLAGAADRAGPLIARVPVRFADSVRTPVSTANGASWSAGCPTRPVSPLPAAQRYLEAGQRALRVGALGTAVELLELARARTGAEYELSAHVQEALVDALALRGDVDRVITVSEALLHTLDRVDAADRERGPRDRGAGRVRVAADGWAPAPSGRLTPIRALNVLLTWPVANLHLVT